MGADRRLFGILATRPGWTTYLVVLLGWPSLLRRPVMRVGSRLCHDSFRRTSGREPVLSCRVLPHAVRRVSAALAVLGALHAVGASGEAAARVADEADRATSASLGAVTERSAEVIIRLRAGVDAEAEARAVVSGGGRVTHMYRSVFPGFSARLSDAAVIALARNPRVASVERDSPVRAAVTQSPAPWGLDRIDQPQLPLSGSFSYPDEATGVAVYVIDTGIYPEHVDFEGRVAPGFTSIADGSGTTDCNGHGTHVAGTVGGRIYGVAKRATLVPVRVLDCDASGSLSGVIAGLDWVAAHHPAGAPAVANVSLSGTASTSLDTAVTALIDDGVTVVVAAGNGNTDACSVSPARVAAAVTVAASDKADVRAPSSNYGNCVDLFAPGVSVTSAAPSGATATAVLSGTSMAAPHVAGAVALLVGRAALTPAEAVSQLLATSTRDVVVDAGTGTPNRLVRVSVSSDMTATVPASPTNVAAKPGRRSAVVKWSLGGDGGSPLSRQTVHVHRAGLTVTSVEVSATSASAKVGGLEADTSYTFTVTATNSIGTSRHSAPSNSVVPRR